MAAYPTLTPDGGPRTEAQVLAKRIVSAFVLIPVVGMALHAGGLATLALVAGAKRARSGMTVEPPLVIYSGKGIYTAEVESLYERAAARRPDPQ